MVNEAYRRLCDIYVTLAGFLLNVIKGKLHVSGAFSQVLNLACVNFYYVLVIVTSIEK